MKWYNVKSRKFSDTYVFTSTVQSCWPGSCRTYTTFCYQVVFPVEKYLTHYWYMLLLCETYSGAVCISILCLIWKYLTTYLSIIQIIVCNNMVRLSKLDRQAGLSYSLMCKTRFMWHICVSYPLYRTYLFAILVPSICLDSENK